MDDINRIIANLTPQDMEMLRGVAASILGDGGQGKRARCGVLSRCTAYAPA